MTFAAPTKCLDPACADGDCCGPGVPPEVQAFVRSYKRRKILASSDLLTSSASSPSALPASGSAETFYDNIDALAASSASPQSRKVLQSGAITVNEITMPPFLPGGDQKPVLEYARGRDRFILIYPGVPPSSTGVPPSSTGVPPSSTGVPPSSTSTAYVLQTLGSGVIGTSSETSSRSTLPWASLQTALPSGAFCPKAAPPESQRPLGFVFAPSPPGEDADPAPSQQPISAKVLIVKRMGDPPPGPAPPPPNPDVEFFEDLARSSPANEPLPQSAIERIDEWLKSKQLVS
ncbi:hypothetical protein TeGR_g8412 [Tetraparma gracilis]|uniref:Uncharacterized protein n=1 Tax=Tetraparma gracilis TaxID=2962635 RepID=A0ABQ6MWG3_9STRA|nr:hypothetical protein TeGR_g8412 [Tetraparma gracilis]